MGPSPMRTLAQVVLHGPVNSDSPVARQEVTASHFVITLQRPERHVSFDLDKEAAVQTRKRMFDMIATDRLPFIGYHMPFPALAYLKREGEGYRYIAETYQLRGK
mgnify:CR=1 FL=1